MNGWQTTPFPLQKLEVILRRDGAFAGWRYARETTFESQGFQTGKNTRLSTTSRFMPHWNEIIRNGRKKVILVNHRSRKRTILFARRPSSKRWFKSLEENWGGNSCHNDSGALRQNAGTATVSRVVPQSLSAAICG